MYDIQAYSFKCGHSISTNFSHAAGVCPTVCGLWNCGIKSAQFHQGFSEERISESVTYWVQHRVSIAHPVRHNYVCNTQVSGKQDASSVIKVGISHHRNFGRVSGL